MSLPRFQVSLAAVGLLAVGCSGDPSTSGEAATESGDTDDGDAGPTGDGETEMGDGDAGDGDGEPGDGDGDDPVCGNGQVEGSEECDDGNLTDQDACTNACATAVCGDGIVHEGVEVCDDADDNNGDDCTTLCMPPVCGDGFINNLEQCDDANMDDTDSCLTACILATCGDGFVWVDNEDCDDANDIDTDACLSTCDGATCGDGFLQDGVEACDDGNLYENDACVGQLCAIAFCGDEVFHAGAEECDDGNMNEFDSCSSMCTSNLPPPSTILLSGTATGQIQTALDSLGEPFMLSFNQWLAPDSADILIMSFIGADRPPPDYIEHLNSGKHVLILGGSNNQEFHDWLSEYVSPGMFGWHYSEDCMSDWDVGDAHPMTALLPAQYEFDDQTVSQHMVHFLDAGQPYAVRLLGHTCHQAPDHHVLVTRPYDNGGSFTYLAFNLGWNAGAGLNQFLVPFLDGYLDWLRS
jgi:cysteine-rich repeat protein